MRGVVAESFSARAQPLFVCATAAATPIEQLRDATQRTAMSISQAVVAQDRITPPSSFTDEPLTPPLTDKKPFATAPRIIAFFRHIQAGRNTNQRPWIEFQLVRGEYDEIVRTLQEDDVLAGYVKDKIR
jgi:hypothetical protein